MISAAIDRIVAATLYEGYILYPYRPSSVKNQVRWTFGGVYPREYSEAVGGSEPWTVVTECLLRADDLDRATVTVAVRFLQVVQRAPARLDVASPAPRVAALTRVDSLSLDGSVHRPWEEAAERELDAGERVVGSLLTHPLELTLRVDAGEEVEWLRNDDGLVAGALLRSHQPLAVQLEISARCLAEEIVSVRVSVSNVTGVTRADVEERAAALHHALVSTHVVLQAGNAAWLSLTDPPADAAVLARSCVNTGLWPVLVGEAGSNDTILASPIILEDHPQVAPESAGDLFDSTEIDEILSLRILTLTDAEKAEMRAADGRARAMLERTEGLTGDDFMRMHGTVRSVSPRVGGQP